MELKECWKIRSHIVIRRPSRVLFLIVCLSPPSAPASWSGQNDVHFFPSILPSLSSPLHQSNPHHMLYSNPRYMFVFESSSHVVFESSSHVVFESSCHVYSNPRHMLYSNPSLTISTRNPS